MYVLDNTYYFIFADDMLCNRVKSVQLECIKSTKNPT